jgi:hypothetical protein
MAERTATPDEVSGVAIATTDGGGVAGGGVAGGGAGAGVGGVATGAGVVATGAGVVAGGVGVATVTVTTGAPPGGGTVTGGVGLDREIPCQLPLVESSRLLCTEPTAAQCELLLVEPQARDVAVVAVVAVVATDSRPRPAVVATTTARPAPDSQTTARRPDSGTGRRATGDPPDWRADTRPAAEENRALGRPAMLCPITSTSKGSAA